MEKSEYLLIEKGSVLEKEEAGATGEQGRIFPWHERSSPGLV
jgi:hypothetical protein